MLGYLIAIAVIILFCGIGSSIESKSGLLVYLLIVFGIIIFIASLFNY